ncbi:MAG: ABC transporter ATP-binding protein [Candidatus Methanomethyliaceae archaeon]|nr:ABC transporter ATP-binding protein [Candidatus Methanomethyliaceae archaeon]MDW7971265.1 ABC transporter ATP-binding protein [Nitrososphaerota archaeon]
MEYAIEVHGLTKKFGNFKAVDNLNLKVKRGEIFGLLGPNGAGKTTTIRMICGLMNQTEGSIKVYGYKIPEERKEAIKIIGYMAQRFSLYEDLTVYENMEFFGRLYGINGINLRERIIELLNFLELNEFKDRLAGKLSGGMRQRLALGVALLHKPKLLILDEPTAGVDPPIRRAFWGYLRGLNKEDVTILITTHYMDEAENCDRIGLMNRGRLIAIGSPRELKRMAFGGDLVEIKVQGRIDELKDFRILEKKVDGENCSLKILLSDASLELPKLLKYMDGAGLKILCAETINVTLEEVFIRMVMES